MTNEQMLTAVRAVQDQEMEEAKTWMANSSNEDLCAIWMRINSESEDVIEDIVNRFATLGYAEAYIRRHDQRPHKAENVE